MVSVGRFALAGCLGVTLAGAQSVSAFHVEPVKPMRKGVDAWPMVSPADTPAAQRVNATLHRLNGRLMRALKDCDANALEAVKASGGGARERAAIADDWQRTVEVTMQGPRYLSLVASDFTDCGGAHPDSSQIALVFDMTTGSPLNWTALLDRRADAKPYSDTVADGSHAGALIVPALQRMSLAAADADCKDGFPDQEPFLLWPDGRRGVLVAMPFDLPHVVQACGDEIDLTMQQARTIGFSETLLAAIEQAHTAGR